MSERRHVVLLIHGIRTQAEWAQRTASILETDPAIRARPIRYEFFDSLRFLLPLAAAREGPIRRLTGLLRDELSRHPKYVSVVAHSFGTYILARILEQEPDIRFHRIILAGSIVPDDFAWSKYAHRLDPDSDGDWHAVNDCGMRDIWPVLAKSVTWGYGSSGRFGFGHTRVKDRFFEIGHSGFFEREFVKTYWVPYLSDGRVLEGVLERATNPWWVSALTVLKLRYLVLLLLLLSAASVNRLIHPSQKNQEPWQNAEMGRPGSGPSPVPTKPLSSGPVPPSLSHATGMGPTAPPQAPQRSAVPTSSPSGSAPQLLDPQKNNTGPRKVSTHTYVQMGAPKADPKTWTGPGVPVADFRESLRGDAELLPGETFWIPPPNQTMSAERPCSWGPSEGWACSLDPSDRLSAYFRNSCNDSPSVGLKVSRGCSRAAPLFGTPGQGIMVQCCFYRDGPAAKGLEFGHTLVEWLSREHN